MKKSSKGKIYISGAVSDGTGKGTLKGYRQKFALAERRFKAAGFEVLNPARMIKVEKWKGYDDYLKEAFLLLFQADFFYALPCWVNSDGARAEVAYAMALNKRGKIVIFVDKKEA